MYGKVTNDKLDKTISVEVIKFKIHKIYKKRIKYTKKYLVHDLKNEAKIGDYVKIIEGRPFSKMKRFYLLKIIEGKKA